MESGSRLHIDPLFSGCYLHLSQYSDIYAGTDLDPLSDPDRLAYYVSKYDPDQDADGHYYPVSDHYSNGNQDSHRNC